MKANNSALIGLRELREETDRYIREIGKGKSFTVLRRSRPIFRITPIDAEEEGWETVIDFTKVKRGGVPAAELLSRL